MIKKFTRAIHRYCWVRRIKAARETMREAFKTDDDFKHGYVANIAMLFYDRYGKGNYITNREKRNQAAEDILDLIFKE